MGRTAHTVLVMACLMLAARAIVWAPLRKVSESDTPKQLPLVFHCKVSNVTHIFWEEENDRKDVYLKYRQLLPNASFSAISTIDPVHPLAYFENLITFVSPDENKHLMIAYGAYRENSHTGCIDIYPQSCLEVLFAESLDGGLSWSVPARINRTDMDAAIHRSLPSIVYEKETGKVWIAYYYNMYAAIVSREPGAKVFSQEKRLWKLYMFGRILHMGYTVDKAAKKKWLHVVWYEEDVDRTKTIYYARSENDAEDWEKTKTLAKCYKGKNLPTLAVNTQAAEGSVFVQYADEKHINIMWSKDHGKTWEANATVANSYAPWNAMAECSHATLKGRVFTMGPGMGIIAGFVKTFEAAAGPLSMTSLTYPFNSIKKMKSPDMHCAIRDNGEVVVAAVTYDEANKQIWLAQGVEDKLKAKTE